MSQLSDDESSDSSNEFLVPADKINLNSSFFSQSARSSNHEKSSIAEESSDDSDDSEEFDFTNDKNAELLSQVARNLERSERLSFDNVTDQPQPSTSADVIDAENQDSTLDKSTDLASEINDLLLQGESADTLSKENDDLEDSKADIKEAYTIPQKGVQIHLPGENLVFNRKRNKQEDLQKLLQNKFNKRIRSSQILIHKAGLLCWLSHGFFLNTLANDPELLKMTVSVVSSSNYPKHRPDLTYIEKFTKWFTGIFQIYENCNDVSYSKELLLKRMSEKKIYNCNELILLYVATIRGMGINCRLVISLQPPPLKPNPDQLLKFETTKENQSNNNVIKKEEPIERISEKSNTKKLETKKGANKSKSKKKSSKTLVPENSPEGSKKVKLENRKQAAAILKKENLKETKSKRGNDKTDKKVSTKDSSDVEDEANLSIAKKLCLRVRKTKNQDSNDINVSTDRRETRSKLKEFKAVEKKKKCSSSSEYFSEEVSEFSTDDDYMQAKPRKRPSNEINKGETISSKLANLGKKSRKILSSDEDENIVAKSKYNVWAEVFVESEESWICVNVLDKKIHCASDIYKKADHPVLYIVAWNSAGTLKDVTRRYCPHWLTDTRKKRVDEKWWAETIINWKERKTTMSKMEDEQLLLRELEQPLPKTVSECKGHPLYVLARHLLKYEALYPPDVVPLGHLKTGDAIYSRHCVHTLYSRETWVKRARVVKLAQEAYKIVKSMPRYDKLSGMKIKDQPLELFGKWQTTPYIPPEAKDGKVPRNEYGNVDLFKKCMIPKGTVHINLPALNRTARKLNIDCAPACVGFNFGCRGAVPAFEGFVVCEEYEDTLREAWEEEQKEAQKRAQIKREKRIYGNWKKLIKGLLIRERLATKYNFRGDDDDEFESQEKEATTSKTKKVIKVPKRVKKEPNNVRKKLKQNST